ncbi:MAG: glycosyltransferase [Flavobacteriales bacterium CG_4_9_14_0_2_um_filter_35_242]|nr:glycosyltransferase [Zetaproteobacteria bacterium]NDK17645.1 glycosyltransferase [Flavobacteriales bacterium]OIO12794.1 MAG: hypothetical protein AUJ53_01290 [Flavobacteriaceae bacterium CG1_02_35_72]PIR13897.1 MAG: glycosyl transferase [Flavobacteriales bacterium CG11_big_fil_rev_8_21_14_0_20_35_7]PIX08077.1 MAG: glycosyltransferase [Flavobacteriales bacterium CG_4_8_14_3_um_filter_35_10]PJA05690.1 MAG: glycosyltransferase [Flavobacteriales bacterium CG_4_10_14_0_2_um_filter_35_18]PJC6077
MMPFITIITATYNSEKTLEQTLKSVLNQTYINFEYIIVDGASTDGTLSILSKYKTLFENKNIAYRWFSEPDRGIYNAWNKGLKLANGRWIAFLGSDDCYLTGALSFYSNKILELKLENYDLIYSRVKLMNNFKVLKIIDGVWTWNIFKRYMNIAHVGALHNKKYFEKYGFFDESYKIAGDYELLLRAKHNLKTYKLDLITAIMGNAGVSNNNINKAFRETFKAKRLTGKIPLGYCYIDYVIAFLKFSFKKVANEIIR